MRKIVGVLGLISLLVLMTVPAWAEWSISGDYVTGEMETNFWNGLNKVNSQSDFKDGILGLGFSNGSFLINYDYLHCNLDTAISGSDVNRLHDLRLGYRFYDTPSFKTAALLSYISDKCGKFEAKGPTIGLGVEWDLPGQWSLESRVGYSPAGVTVENAPYLEYDDADLLTAAMALNYQLNNNWSVHAGYRYYAFSADNHNVDLKSTVDLCTIGVTYKFADKAETTPAEEPEVTTESAEEPEVITEPAEEPEVTTESAEEPEVTTEPAEEPEVTTEPAEEPEVTTEPAEEPEVTTEPAEEPEVTTEPVEEPEVTTEPAEEPQVTPASEPANGFLQPIFFDFNKEEIRPDQIAVLEKDLAIIKENPDQWVLIGGHADQRGKSDYNMQLSLRRAKNVKNWMVSNGVSGERLLVAAYGEKNGYFHSAKDSNWESDRFVDLVVTNEVPNEDMGIRK